MVIDAETPERIDPLPDRTADTLEAWLRAPPGVEVICCALPKTAQVADRWHLWRSHPQRGEGAQHLLGPRPGRTHHHDGRASKTLGVPRKTWILMGSEDLAGPFQHGFRAGRPPSFAF
nr:hypothetical protein [Micromonospora wenchangensis]